MKCKAFLNEISGVFGQTAGHGRGSPLLDGMDKLLPQSALEKAQGDNDVAERNIARSALYIRHVRFQIVKDLGIGHEHFISNR